MSFVSDPRLIRREIYNPNNFDIVVTIDPRHALYVCQAGIKLGPQRQVLKSKDRIILNHVYVIFTATNGAELINLVEIFGDSIGKGETKPSLPILEAR